MSRPAFAFIDLPIGWQLILVLLATSTSTWWGALVRGWSTEIDWPLLPGVTATLFGTVVIMWVCYRPLAALIWRLKHGRARKVPAQRLETSGPIRRSEGHR